MWCVKWDFFDWGAGYAYLSKHWHLWTVYLMNIFSYMHCIYCRWANFGLLSSVLCFKFQVLSVSVNKLYYWIRSSNVYSCNFLFEKSYFALMTVCSGYRNFFVRRNKGIRYFKCFFLFTYDVLQKVISHCNILR